MEGWVKTYRSLLDWEWFGNSAMVHLFMYCLLKANHEPKKWHGMDISRGQFVTSRETICRETHLSDQVVRTCLNRLKSTSEITSQSTSRNTIITITRYDDYQGVDDENNQPINQPANQQLTNNQPTNNQQITTNKKERMKERKKIRDKEIAADVVVVLSENPEDLISDDSINPDLKEKSCAKKENPAFEKFRKWIADNAPNVGKLKEPFTEDEFVRLKVDFSTDQIQETLKAMHNWKPLLTKNINANITFRRWTAKQTTEKSYGKTIKPPPASDAELMQAVAEGLSRSRTRQEWE